MIARSSNYSHQPASFREADLIDQEITRLTNDELGFPAPLARYMAVRAYQAGWLPVADPSLPAGPTNVAQATARR